MVTTFLYSLAGGMLIVIATGRAEQIAWRYLRLVGIIVFAVMCGVTAWHVARSGIDNAPGGAWAVAFGAGPTVGAAAIVLMAPFAKRISRTFRAVCGLSGLVGLSAAALAAMGRPDNEPLNHWAPAMVIVSQVLSALLLGSVTIAWLLGHSYLTAPNMTIAPLRHFSRMLSWAVAARIMFLIVSLAFAWTIERKTHLPFPAQLGNAWLILTLRLGVGLAAVSVFAYMVSDCVRLRATQSATGILYFALVFVFIGELASQQLVEVCGWPL